MTAADAVCPWPAGTGEGKGMSAEEYERFSRLQQHRPVSVDPGAVDAESNDFAVLRRSAVLSVSAAGHSSPSGPGAAKG